jgi:hypothetical protein
MKILFIYKRDIPIDDETNFDVLRFPKKIVDRMNKAEIEYVLEKCEVYKKIEKNPDFKSFWDHVKVLAACHLDRLIRYEMRKKGSINIQSVVGEEYSQEVESAFKDKTFKDLIALEEQAKKLLNSTEFVVDVEFWEQMLSKIAVQKAVMQLEELYVKHLHTKQVEAKPTENDNAKDLLRDDIFEDTQTSDPLSPKLYRGDPFKSSIKVYKEDEYTKRIEKVRQQSYDTELKVLIKLAEKEIENRKNKDLLMEENNEISDVEEEEALDLDEEDKQLRAIMRKEDSKDPEDEFAFEDLEVSKKVAALLLRTTSGSTASSLASRTTSTASRWAMSGPRSTRRTTISKPRHRSRS